MCKPSLPQIFQDLIRTRKIDRTRGYSIATADDLFASNFNTTDSLRVAWLKSDGSPRRNIEKIAIGLEAVEV